jgi:hypothetical protein
MHTWDLLLPLVTTMLRGEGSFDRQSSPGDAARPAYTQRSEVLAG